MLKLHADLVSQPARAVYIFLKANGIEFELVRKNLFKGKLYKKEYLPLGVQFCILKIPVKFN